MVGVRTTFRLQVFADLDGKLAVGTEKHTRRVSEAS